MKSKTVIYKISGSAKVWDLSKAVGPNIYTNCRTAHPLLENTSSNIGFSLFFTSSNFIKIFRATVPVEGKYSIGSCWVPEYLWQMKAYVLSNALRPTPFRAFNGRKSRMMNSEQVFLINDISSWVKSSLYRLIRTGFSLDSFNNKYARHCSCIISTQNIISYFGGKRFYLHVRLIRII